MAATFSPAATTLRRLNSRVSAATLSSFIHSGNLTHITFSPTTNSAISRLRHRDRFCSVVASAVSASKSEPLKFERIREFPKKFKVVDIREGTDEGLNKLGETVVVRGWVRTLRIQSSATFIEVNDGSCLSNMQCVMSSDADGYDQVENGMISTGASVWIQGIIVGSQGSKQKVELKVEKLVTEMGPNVRGDPPISDKIFEHGRKFGSYRQGDSTFYSLIEHHASCGDFRALEMVFELMKREKRTFIEKSFIFVFRAYGRAHLPLKAAELFDRMVDEFQCRQTVKSLNSVLTVIVQEGLYQRALEFFDHVVDISPNVLTFNLAIKALCKSKNASKALEVFRDMPRLRCVPDVYTYCTLMDGLCKEDRIDDAVALLDEMQVEGCYPSAATFNVLINGLCKKGELTRAGKLVENMFLKGCKPNEVTYNTLIHGLCLRGKLDKAVSLLAQMLSNKHIPNDITYGTIINGFVKQGRAVDGVQVLKAMEERGYKANEYAYSTLISGFFKEGKSEYAFKLWKQMIEQGCKPNTVVYSALIDGLCREGKPYEAESFLYEMIDFGCMPNAFTYSSLMRGFFEVGSCDKAFLVWKEIAQKDYMDNEVCYSVLIHGLCKSGNLKQALMIWKQFLAKGFAPDVVAYSSMIHGLCAAGSVKQGLHLFNEMMCQVPNIKPDVVTYNILLLALCKQGSISHAIDLLNDMINQECDPDSVTCNIFLTYSKEKFNPLQDGREFLNELVLRLYKRRRIVGASEVIEVMLKAFLHPKESTWEKVIVELCKPKKIVAAIDKCWAQLFM